MGLALLLSFVNFVVLNYNMLISNVSSLRNVFSHLWMFALVFFSTYIPLCAIIGYKFYRKKQLPAEQMLSTKVNPWAQDLAKALTLIAQQLEIPEVEEIMRKWMKD